MDEARSTAETHHSRVRAGMQIMVTGAKNPTSTNRPHHSALASRKKPTQTHPDCCYPRKRLYRARYYHAELGRFISRDPIGYVDGMNLYRGYFVPAETDPSGEVVVTYLKAGLLNPKCPPPIRGIRRYKFAVSGNWPCRGQIGVFVQRVTVKCVLAGCKNNPPNIHESFVYWEAFRVRKGKTIADFAGFEASTPRSSYRQNGVIKFFCVAPKGMQPLPNEIEREMGDDWRRDNAWIPNANSACRTKARNLPYTTTMPSFWSKPSSDGVTANRRFSMLWNCCCGKPYARIEVKP
jgi:hypothetical protein